MDTDYDGKDEQHVAHRRHHVEEAGLPAVKTSSYDDGERVCGGPGGG